MRTFRIAPLTLFIAISGCGGEDSVDDGVTPKEAGPSDAAAPDSGPADAGTEADAGQADAGASDAGVVLYTYAVYFADGPDRAQTEELGRFGYTSGGAWQHRRLAFVAPGNADQLPLLYFVPTSTIGSTYPGLDNLNLIQTSSCP